MISHDEIRGNLLRWIEDLETTDAKQAKRALRTKDEGYCCLGRAALSLGISIDIHDPESGEGTMKSVIPDRWAYRAADSTLVGSVLAKADAERLGLTGMDMQTCWMMNDEKEWTFPQIAAWLRENILPRYPQSAVAEPSDATAEATR